MDKFWQEHDTVLSFVGENPLTPAIHPATGDQTWPFSDGRYRLFFKFAKRERVIYLTHLIDNRRLNLQIYPNNAMPTFDED